MNDNEKWESLSLESSSTTLVPEEKDPSELEAAAKTSPRRSHRSTIFIILNYSIGTLLLLFLFTHTLLNIIETLSPSLTHVAHPPHAPPPGSCNGHPALCNRSYDSITQIGTHGSPFVGILPTDNQNLHLVAQLDGGIRFLQAQTHLDGVGQLSLCHTTCGIKNAGTLEDYLRVLVKWMSVHPREVVTLLLTNEDGVPISTFASAYRSSGAENISYTPPPPPSSSPKHQHSNSSQTTTTTTTTTTWPTLISMISSKHRLVTFLTSPTNPTLAPYILPEWIHFFETPYDISSPTTLSSTCPIDRPRSLPQNNNRMYIVNHFLDTKLLFGWLVPDRRDAGRTNAGSLDAHVKVCEKVHGGRKPRVVLVDYFEKGNVMRWEREVNGLL